MYLLYINHKFIYVSTHHPEVGWNVCLYVICKCLDETPTYFLVLGCMISFVTKKKVSELEIYIQNTRSNTIVNYTTGGNVNKAAALEKVKQSYHMTQQFHSQVFTQQRWKLRSTQKHVHEMFIAAIFIIAKKQKQAKCLSTNR